MIELLFLILGAEVSRPTPDLKEPLAAYRQCVLDHANAFRVSDLSGDSPLIVTNAAFLACDAERSSLILKVKGRVSAKSEIGPGSIAKVSSIFIGQVETRLSEEIAEIFKAP